MAIRVIKAIQGSETPNRKIRLKGMMFRVRAIRVRAAGPALRAVAAGEEGLEPRMPRYPNRRKRPIFRKRGPVPPIWTPPKARPR